MIQGLVTLGFRVPVFVVGGGRGVSASSGCCLDRGSEAFKTREDFGTCDNSLHVVGASMYVAEQRYLQHISCLRSVRHLCC